MSRSKFIVITGPTAAGKTKVAVSIAKELKSQIISADSMQIYKGMDIGTAKATKKEMDGIVHHFLDIVSPQEDYSAAVFQKEAFGVIDKLNNKGIVPIVAGGTGLYINSLVYKLDFCGSNKNESFRQKYAQLARDKSVLHLYNILKEKDPKYANIISSNDKRRIIRRLEIIENSGPQHYDFRQKNDNYDILIIGLCLPREILYERTDKRVDDMLQNGLIEEARALYENYGNVKASKAIGYKELFAYFDGEYDINEAVRLIKRNTRRYAKRQLTWFRADERIQWFDVLSKACIEDTINDIINYIEEKGF